MRPRRLRFELERFDYVAVGRDVLLRLAGHWYARRPATLGDLGEPRLIAQLPTGPIEANPVLDPGRVTPAATPAGAAWHGAFSLPLEVATRAVGYALVVAGEQDVPLPVPVAAHLRAPVAQAPPDEEDGGDEDALARERARREAAERDLAHQLSSKQTLREELRRTADELEQSQRRVELLRGGASEPDAAGRERLGRLRDAAAGALAGLGGLERRVEHLGRVAAALPDTGPETFPQSDLAQRRLRRVAEERLGEVAGLEERVMAVRDLL